MAKTLNIELESGEFFLREFNDCNGEISIDVYHNNKHIGELNGVSIPDSEDEEFYQENLENLKKNSQI